MEGDPQPSGEGGGSAVPAQSRIHPCAAMCAAGTSSSELLFGAGVT